MTTWIWKKAGLAKLGEIIRRSREARGLDLRNASYLISDISGVNVSHSTLGTVERSSAKPDYNTLAAIAASGMVEKDGRKLNIFDFIYIASEIEDEIYMDALAKLIESHLIQHGMSLSEFASQTGVNLAHLNSIMRGDRPPVSDYDWETDLILIAGHLLNPLTNRRFHSYLELVDYCGMSKDGMGQTHATQNGTNCINLG